MALPSLATAMIEYHSNLHLSTPFFGFFEKLRFLFKNRAALAAGDPDLPLSPGHTHFHAARGAFEDLIFHPLLFSIVKGLGTTTKPVHPSGEPAVFFLPPLYVSGQRPKNSDAGCKQKQIEQESPPAARDEP